VKEESIKKFMKLSSGESELAKQSIEEAARFEIIGEVKINDVTLAVDVINKVGPTDHYLNQKHTKEWWFPKIGGRIGLDARLKGNKKNIVYQAKEIAEKILEKYYPKLLFSDVQKEIDEIIESYTKMLS